MNYKPEGYLLSSAENHEALCSLSALERSLDRGRILESTALLCDSDFTLHFDLYGIRGLMPRSEVQFSPQGEESKDIAILTRVGKPTCFKIIGFQKDRSGKTVAILSRKAAQADCYYAYISTLIPGDILPARITHTESFGAFADIGCGMISLLPIDAISVSRIAHPRDRYKPGDRIYVLIRSIDSTGRIYVSSRELLGTWQENASRFSVGQTVVGVVRSIESYGIFIELAPNLAGLAEPKANVEVGASAAVYIKSILPEKMKIKLVIIDTYRETQEPPPPTYFIDPKKTAHIDLWRYSPEECPKIIESRFEK